jgi:nucleoside phosphorylase
MSLKKLSHDDYTVGWICALPPEMAAAKAMLDEVHAKLSQAPNDHNTYTLGAINGHNVVIACLPSGAYGTTSAAVVAAQMLSTFREIRFGLMVGIGGGVPSEEADIRLGDIVVSKPTDTIGGVVQYDYGKTISGGRFQRTGVLNKPPEVLLTAISDLQADHMMGLSQIPKILSYLAVKYPEMSQFTYRGQQLDQLFEAEYDHIGSGNTCAHCDRSRLVTRQIRIKSNPKIHYGLIASGNQVMKHGRTRDQLAQELGILSFEMEAAGLMDQFPCLVIRGICDYCDSHKNKQWQEYAAAAAAAYAKELLSAIPVRNIWKTETANSTLSQAGKFLEFTSRRRITINSHMLAEDIFRLPFDLTGIPAINEYVGREVDLDRLWDFLQPQRSNLRKVVVLHGLGGMGKTQLAIRFARMHKDDFTAIFWLNGKDREALVQSLASVLPRLQGASHTSDPKNEEEVKQQARQTLKWLAADGNSKWLLVFDNIDRCSPGDTQNGEGYDISEFFPPTDHGSIIITTRRPQFRELGKSYPVQKLNTEDAVQLLINSSGYSHEENTTTTSLGQGKLFLMFA